MTLAFGQCVSPFPTASQRAHDAIITSSLRPNDVADVVLTFWRRYHCVIIAWCVRWDPTHWLIGKKTCLTHIWCNIRLIWYQAWQMQSIRYSDMGSGIVVKWSCPQAYPQCPFWTLYFYSDLTLLQSFCHWQHNFQRKLRSYTLKVMRQHHLAVVLQGPAASGWTFKISNVYKRAH